MPLFSRSKIKGLVSGLDRGLYKLESVLVIVTLSIMVIIALLQVVLRNVFAVSISWGDPGLRHLVLWIGFIGAALATHDDRHIRIDVLYQALPEVWQKRLRPVVQLFSALIGALLAKASLSFVRDEWRASSKLYGDIPLWPFISIIFLGFAVITLHFLLKAFHAAPAGEADSERA